MERNDTNWMPPQKKSYIKFHKPRQRHEPFVSVRKCPCLQNNGSGMKGTAISMRYVNKTKPKWLISYVAVSPPYTYPTHPPCIFHRKPTYSTVLKIICSNKTFSNTYASMAESTITKLIWSHLRHQHSWRTQFAGKWWNNFSSIAKCPQLFFDKSCVESLTVQPFFTGPNWTIDQFDFHRKWEMTCSPFRPGTDRTVGPGYRTPDV